MKAKWTERTISTLLGFGLFALACTSNAHAGDSTVAFFSTYFSTGSGFEETTESRSPMKYATSTRWLMGDFDGDGRDDLGVIYDAYPYDGKASALVSFSTGSEFDLRGDSTFAGFSSSQRWLAGDFNGDGRDDLVNVYGNSGQARAWVHESTGDGFEYKSSFTTLAGFSSSQRWLVGDFNGDGRDDLVNVYGNSGQARAWVHESTGDGFEYQSSFTILGEFNDDMQHWLVGDVDGDGLDDLTSVTGIFVVF